MDELRQLIGLVADRLQTATDDELPEMRELLQGLVDVARLLVEESKARLCGQGAELFVNQAKARMADVRARLNDVDAPAICPQCGRFHYVVATKHAEFKDSHPTEEMSVTCDRCGQPFSVRLRG